jgi:pSer/pThr/pTyr-binding forkhead associated (FHA) protein
MAKLILSMDGLILKEYTLAKERTTIGRKPHNDIQIDNLAVSGEHAVVVSILNDSFLEDLGSTNGTLVNGQPIKKHFLQNNDVIELGKYKLKYIHEQTGQAKAADFEKTMVLRPGAMKAMQQPAAAPSAAAAVPAAGAVHAAAPPAPPAPPAPGATTPPAGRSFGDTAVNQGPLAAAAGPAAAASPAVPPKPAAAPAPRIGILQLLTGGNAGKALDLVKPLTTLGKPGVQVAVITRRPQGYFITHVEGARFPVLNGKTLDAQAHPLADHDMIEIAGVKMEFYYKT